MLCLTLLHFLMFVSPVLSIMIISFSVYTLLVPLHVYLACVTFWSFSLPLGVGLLRLVIIALPGLFI